MACRYEQCMDAAACPDIHLLLFPDFGDSDVLDEIQELELEEQQNTIYIPVGISADVRIGLSCSSCDNIVVSHPLCGFIQEKYLTL